MLAALLLGLQVAGPPAHMPERLRVERSCPAEAGEPGEVVVCGRPDQERFRLKPLGDRAEPAIPRAEFNLLENVKAAAEVEQVDVGGLPSNRIMLRLKLPF